MKNIYGIVLATTALLFSGTVGAQSGLTLKNRSAVRTTNLVNVSALPHHGSANAQRGGGAPANDACGQTSTVALAAGASITFSGDNTNATEGGDFEPGSGLDGFGPVVWHKFSTSECTNVTVSYCATSPGFGNVAAFLARTCPATDADYVLFSTGDFTTCAAGDNATLHFNNLDAGEYYFPVLMDTAAATYAVGPYSIDVSAEACSAAPANDDCTGAVNEDLAVDSTLTFSGDNTGATEDGGTGFVMVWHAFTTTECANITINYCVPGFEFDNFLVNLAVQCPDFITGVLSGTSDSCTVAFEALPAGMYYIPVMVDPATTPVGAYTIEVSAAPCATPPDNDECAGAVDLTPAVDCVPVAGTTDGATQSMDPILCNGFTSANANDVWYSFTATETDHTVTVEGIGTFDAVLELFSGDCSGLTSIVCEDGNYPTTGPATEVMVLSGLSVGQTYYVRVYDYAHASTGHNFNICVTSGAPPAAYCIPTGADPSDGDYIANVTLGTINNTTVGDNNYEDYTAQSTMVEQGGSYTLSITSGAYGEDYYAAWIDYNVDSTFQATEKLGEFAGTTAGELIALPFTVPMDATLGNTRLRVRCAWDAMDMDPCEDYGYGEIEDYSVDITIPTGVRELNSMNVTVFPNPTKGDITISGADLSGTVNFELTDMTGRVVYKDQKSMTANQPVTLPLNGKLAQGTYTLRLITANGISSRPVMIK